MGPVTMITEPIVRTTRGLFYWSDKLLGGVLGLLKGMLGGYVILAIAVYADRGGYPNALARSAETSRADASPWLEGLPVIRRFRREVLGR